MHLLSSVEKVKLESPQGYASPNKYGLYRIGKPEHLLSVVGSRYTVLQDCELLASFKTVLKTNNLNTEGIEAKYWKKTKWVTFQAPLPPVEIRNELMNRYLAAMNSHGGGAAVLGTTNKVISCQNQFAMFAKNNHRILHGSNVRGQLSITASDLAETLEKELRQVKLFREAAETHADKYDAIRLGAKLTAVSRESFEKIWEGADDVRQIDLLDWRGEKVSTRKKNIVKALTESMDMEMQPNRKGQTMWGLFNSVTYWTNHLLGGERTVFEGKKYQLNMSAYRDAIVFS